MSSSWPHRIPRNGTLHRNQKARSAHFCSEAPPKPHAPPGMTELCEYEMQRRENIRRNEAELIKLGLMNLERKKPVRKQNVRPTRQPKARERRKTHEKVGKRVVVLWDNHEPFFGKVIRYESMKANALLVKYDDGEEHWEAEKDIKPFESFIPVDD